MSGAISLTVNGKGVEARPGVTILELANELGIGIPTLCLHKDLSPTGACRISSGIGQVGLQRGVRCSARSCT